MKTVQEIDWIYSGQPKPYADTIKEGVLLTHDRTWMGKEQEKKWAQGMIARMIDMRSDLPLSSDKREWHETYLEKLERKENGWYFKAIQPYCD
jgi:hypothetical protein